LKTKIIALESHDDLVSVRDQLLWAKTARVLLVWPKYEQVDLRVLDLKVLQRHASSLGSQLGLVTRRENIRRDAEALGIPVFVSSSAAQREQWPDASASGPRARRRWRAPRRDLRKLRTESGAVEARWRTSAAIRTATFSAGVLAVLALAGLFVPRAEIIVYPVVQEQELVIPVTASADIASVSIAGTVPVHAISVEVQAEQAMAVSGEILTPQGRARGLARFTNLTEDAVEIPAGTVVYAAQVTPIRFMTGHDTRLLPGLDEIVEVPIEAMLAGSSGNLPAEAIQGIEGAIGLAATVTNPKPTTGGSDLKAVGPSEAERSHLHAVVLDLLLREADVRIRAELDAGDVLIAGALRQTQNLEETFEPPTGHPGETLRLKLRAEFAGQYVSFQELMELASAALDAAIPPGFVPSGSVRLTPEDVRFDADGVTHFSLRAKRTLLRQVDAGRVLVLVRGRRLDEAQQNLRTEFSGRAPAGVTLTPAWWPTLPLIPFSISVSIQ